MYTCCKHVGYIVDACWLHVGCMLDTCWIQVGYMLDTGWIQVGYSVDAWCGSCARVGSYFGHPVYIYIYIYISSMIIALYYSSCC
jgi:hypothetical protein